MHLHLPKFTMNMTKDIKNRKKSIAVSEVMLKINMFDTFLELIK